MTSWPESCSPRNQSPISSTCTARLTQSGAAPLNSLAYGLADPELSLNKELAAHQPPTAVQTPHRDVSTTKEQ
jgi:hypothetical protein